MFMVQQKKYGDQTLLCDLRSQMDLHFFLTYFNILVRMIEEDKELSIKFLCRLMDIYRYMLSHKKNAVTSLEKELSSLSAFFFLHKMIYDEGIQLDIRVAHCYYKKSILPATMLLTLINAIRQYPISNTSPLVIEIYIHEDFLVIRSTYAPRKRLKPEAGVEKIIERYMLLSERKPVILQTEQFFVVKIPLLE